LHDFAAIARRLALLLNAANREQFVIFAQ